MTAAFLMCMQLRMRYPCDTNVLLLIGACEYQLHNFEKCIAANNMALSINPGIPEGYANMGNAFLQQGNIDMAIIYYGKAISLSPSFLEAYVNLGTAYLRKGWLAQAIESYSTAIAINPQAPLIHCQLGDVWRLQGTDDSRIRALTCYRSALALDPQFWMAWKGLGDCARESGSFHDALTHYSTAVDIRQSGEVFNLMGICHRELKNHVAAEEAFRKAVNIVPTCSNTIGNLAGALYENRKLDEAIKMYQKALSINPNFPEALNNLGNAFRESRRPHDAITCYTSCIQLQLAMLSMIGLPFTAMDELVRQQTYRLSVSYNNLGGILKLIGRTVECITAYEHVAMLQPTMPEAHANLASAYKDAGRHDEAIISYQKSLALKPTYRDAFANMVHSLQCVCEWSHRSTLFAKLEEDIKEDIESGAFPCVQPFHAMSYPVSADLALNISKRYAEHCFNCAQMLPGTSSLVIKHPLPHPRSSKEKLKVAYVSSDFGNHPLSHLMGSVFGLHSKSGRGKVEAFCYSLSENDGSEFYKRVSEEADHFLDVSSWSAVEIAHKISQDGIHIAVNLNGYTKGARNEIFALRPAPIQISLMGFPATMGADYIDYIVLDKIVCPPSSRHCYSENIVFMPDTYFANDYKQSHRDILEDSKIPTRASIGLPEDKIIYSCANQLYKYDPDTFAAWCRILRRVPNSVLWLLRFPPAGEARIRAAAAMHGIDSNQIIFTDVASKSLHIARSGLADVFLDTPMCNAHTTGCDVLWGGCPIVTLPLERMASRVAASLCHATGLGDAMVVNSLEEYENRAVELGLDRAKRLALRQALREARTHCPLFDTEKYVDNLEKAYCKMWDIYIQGNRPHDFSVSS